MSARSHSIPHPGDTHTHVSALLPVATCHVSRVTSPSCGSSAWPEEGASWSRTIELMAGVPHGVLGTCAPHNHHGGDEPETQAGPTPPAEAHLRRVAPRADRAGEALVFITENPWGHCCGDSNPAKASVRPGGGRLALAQTAPAWDGSRPSSTTASLRLPCSPCQAQHPPGDKGSRGPGKVPIGHTRVTLARS